jgi:hypothetical protein
MTGVRADGSEVTKATMAANKAATNGASRRPHREIKEDAMTGAGKMTDGPGDDESPSRNKGTGTSRSPCRLTGAWFYLSFTFHTFIL